eukprot:7177047-Alexandrium_andersonii.AAC.1
MNGIPDKKRPMQWKAATTEKRTKFLGMTRSGIRDLVSHELAVLVSPSVRYTCLELAVLQKRYNEYLPTRDILLDRLRKASTEQEQHDAYNAIIALDKEIE